MCPRWFWHSDKPKAFGQSFGHIRNREARLLAFFDRDSSGARRLRSFGNLPVILMPGCAFCGDEMHKLGVTRRVLALAAIDRFCSTASLCAFCREQLQLFSAPPIWQTCARSTHERLSHTHNCANCLSSLGLPPLFGKAFLLAVWL